MASFDFSGISKGGVQADYSYLLDALSIKENQLAADGNLSPGDYKLLKSQAMAAYNHPGLTPQDRSKLLVKVSDYDKGSQVASKKTANDVTALNNDVKDETSKQSMLLGNNPVALAQARSDTLQVKLGRLSSTIEDLQNSGQDASAVINEYNSTLSDYTDAHQAVQDISAGATNPGQPSGSTVAYVKTNSKGEITDVQFGRVGSQNGYVETNGLYGGLPVYGKINQKTDGKNVFKMGNTTFSAPDIAIPDASNPGVMKTQTLTADDQKTALGGGLNSTTAGQYKIIDPTSLRTQSYIPDGSFAKSTNGTIYQNKGGSYTKYVNSNPATIGSNDQNTISIPSEFENNLIPNVSTTIDGSAPFAPATSPDSVGGAPAAPHAATSTPPGVAGPVAALPGAGNPAAIPGAPAPAATSTPPAAPAPAGRSNTPPPTNAAPTGLGAVAGGAFKSAQSFLQGLFK